MSHEESSWEPHDHEALVHSHRHYHVTHNVTETGDFVHLSSAHSHEHDHAAVDHSHHPHENFEREHAGEAHIHHHAAPVNGDAAPAPAKVVRKAATKKASKPAAPADS